VGDGVVVEIKSCVRRLADFDIKALDDWEGLVWQSQQLAFLIAEGITNGARSVLDPRGDPQSVSSTIRGPVD